MTTRRRGGFEKVNVRNGRKRREIDMIGGAL